MTGLRTMYDWVKATREEVFRYCAKLPSDAFLRELKGFGHGSVRDTLFHASHCYWYWLEGVAFGQEVPSYGTYVEYPDVAAIRSAFARSDKAMANFLEHFRAAPDTTISVSVTWQPEPLIATPRWLFTHTVTHEFHHKGQVVAMGRLLGYPPPETDLFRPEF